jgi:acyl carrier protein
MHASASFPLTTFPSHAIVDAGLRDTLRRCPPPTLEAVAAYRSSGDVRHVPTIVLGIVARFVDPELRPRLQDPDSELRMAEDLGLDSLALLEVVLLTEEVLRVTLDAEELRPIHTLAELREFIIRKLTTAT